MPYSTPASRVVLGVSLTIAIVLIAVVVFSRPAVTKQDTRLDLRPQKDPAAISSESKTTPQARDLPPTGGRESDSGNSGAGSDGPVILPEDRPPGRQDTEAIVGAAERQESQTESLPMDTVDQVSEESDATDTSPQANVTLAKPAQKKKVPDKATATRETPKKTTRENGAADSSNKKNLDTGKKGVQADPLKRLSAEFARRAAAKGRPRTQTTVVTPPDHELFPPSVVMSAKHRESCVVFVGESMPDGTMKDLAGEEHSIHRAFGKRLTAIVFWNTRNPYALDQFEELQNDLLPFREMGVRAIAVHVGEAPGNYADLCRQFGQDALCVTDPDETYFGKVAAGRVPRVYLLDVSGKVLWLDIEYSRTTRYELHNAIHFFLQQDDRAAKKAEKKAAK